MISIGYCRSCVVVQVSYLGSLIGLTLWSRDYTNSTDQLEELSNPCKNSHPDKIVAYFSMIHVGIWVMVGVVDRCVNVGIWLMVGVVDRCVNVRIWVMGVVDRCVNVGIWVMGVVDRCVKGALALQKQPLQKPA